MIPEYLYNPPIEIEHLSYGKIKFSVICDDKLIGGTKQRGLVPFILNSPYKTFVAYGASTGFAQIALAYAAQLTNRKAVMFIYKMTPDSIATTKAKDKVFENSIVIKEITKHGKMDELRNIAQKYVDGEKNATLLSFGLSNSDYINYLISSIKSALPRSFNPDRLWLVAGSATILKALDTILPRTKFIVVQVGRKIWDDQLERNDPKSPKSTLYISPLPFYKEIDKKDTPPYNSLLSYDAKLWPFFKKYGKNGDVIWNVAGQN